MSGFAPHAPDLMAPPATSAAGRTVVFNADDFGMSDAVNRGIVAAHTDGVVTSASLMVHGEAAEAAAALARRYPGLAVGLHLDLAEWVRRDGRWAPRYQRVPLDDPAAVRTEVSLQLERFRELMGADPTHLDSHQHVHMSEPVRGIALAAARRLGVPLRGVCPWIRHQGGFYGQDGRGEPFPDGISPDGLQALLARLRPGITEIGCHPATEAVPDPYGAERVTELATLCHPTIVDAIRTESIALRSFLDLNTIGDPWAM